MGNFPLLLLILMGVLFLSYFTIGLVTYTVLEGSMLPSIQQGDRVLVDRIFWRFKRPKNSQLLIFDSDGKRVIKRVIFVGNQKIPVEKNLGIYVGKTLVPLNSNIEWPIHNGILQIPKDQYFVLGDNLSQSHDSRHYGLINKKKIAGSVLGILKSS